MSIRVLIVITSPFGCFESSQSVYEDDAGSGEAGNIVNTGGIARNPTATSIDKADAYALEDSGTYAADTGKSNDANARIPECGDGAALDLSIAGASSGFTYFVKNVNAPCEPPPVEFWVTNNGSTTAEIDKFVIGPNVFAVEEMNLPWEIPPAGFKAIKIRFSPNAVSITEGALVLTSKQGCARIPLRGKATDEGSAISQNVGGVIYFGELLPGESSTPKKISFLHEDADVAPDTVAGEPYLYSETEGAFTKVSSTGGDGFFKRCDERSISVIFTAPDAPGRYEGAISWGIGPADLGMVLYGDTVEP